VIRFTCGCVDRVELDGDTEFLRKYFSFDAEGFIVCPVHRARRYGWRVPNHTHRFAGYTALEYERYVIWNEKPRPRKLVLDEEGAPDLRPYIYDTMLDERARMAIAGVLADTNGHMPQ
jgi:hypothetical protein